MRTRISLAVFALLTFVPGIAWAAFELGGAHANNIFSYILQLIEPAEKWMWFLVFPGIIFAIINKTVRRGCQIFGILGLVYFLFYWGKQYAIGFLVGYVIYRILLWMGKKVPIIGSIAATIAGWVTSGARKVWDEVRGYLGVFTLYGIIGSEWVTKLEFKGFQVGLLPLIVLFLGSCIALLQSAYRRGWLQKGPEWLKALLRIKKKREAQQQGLEQTKEERDKAKEELRKPREKWVYCPDTSCINPHNGQRTRLKPNYDRCWVCKKTYNEANYEAGKGKPNSGRAFSESEDEPTAQSGAEIVLHHPQTLSEVVRLLK